MGEIRYLPRRSTLSNTVQGNIYITPLSFLPLGPSALPRPAPASSAWCAVWTRCAFRHRSVTCLLEQRDVVRLGTTCQSLGEIQRRFAAGQEAFPLRWVGRFIERGLGVVFVCTAAGEGVHDDEKEAWWVRVIGSPCTRFVGAI